MMEQISEGSLTSMGDPTFLFLNLIPIANDEFLAAYSGENGSHLMRYYYSADTPAVPDQIVKIYSLYDNQGLRQAIAKIQKENPGMQIKYQAGMTGEDAITVSDALRTLNTEIMAGKGPDILILDEILGILDEGILTLEELCALISQARQSEAELIMTGTVYPAALDEWVDEVTKLQTRFE